MIPQRAATLYRFARPTVVPINSRRMLSQQTSGTQEPGKSKAKLVFRFGPRDVPVELWPMGAVVFAGIVGAGFAISRHFYKDEDLRLHKSVHTTSK